jgi:hypothetical protein
MNAILACLLLAPVQEPWGAVDDGGTEAYLRFRAGVWASRGFSFEAIRPNATQVKIDEEVLPAAGLDLGLVVADKFLVFLSGDYAGTDDIALPALGAGIGYREVRKADSARGVPDEVSVYAGGFYGRFEVDAEDFGDFDDAVGFRAGLALTWIPSRGSSIGVVAEYRLVEFDYEEEVLEGDRHAGGSSGWIGAAFDLRF